MPERPVTLSAAAVVEGLEGAFLAGVGVFVGVEAAIGRPSDLASAIVLAFAAVLTGAGVLAVGWALWRVRRWGRAPALLTQVFGIIIAVSMFQSHQPAIGAALVAVCVAGAVTLMAPPSTRALTE